MKLYFQTARGRDGAVCLTRQHHKGIARVDLREWFRPTPDAELQPTRRGIWIPLSEVPALRAALDAIEQDRTP